MAEGKSNSAIASQLWVTEGTVEKHVRSILMKLHLPESDDVHRRVLAVLTFLGRLRHRDLPLGAEDPLDPRRRKLCLRQESRHRIFRDQIGVVRLRAG